MTAPRNSRNANTPDDGLAAGILAALDLAIFERGPDGLFHRAGPVPRWFEEIVPDPADPLDLTEVFPFLEVFFAELPDDQTAVSRSDQWREHDREGRERHLQAVALNVDGRRVVIIEPAVGAVEQQGAQQRGNDAKLAKLEIERLNRKLEQATRAKSDFLASMSHEIRTPMNAILGMAELLDRTELTPGQRKYVQVFQRAGETLLNLINGILDLSKVESGRVELETVDFDLAGVVAKALEIIEVRAARKGLTVASRIADGVPARLRGDPGRLQQVLINLLGNSMKFTEKGGLETLVEPDPEGQEPGALRFAVTDTGIGIPADKLDSIFENFTQADSSTTRKYGGTGLGLSISRHLVALMQGRIWVTSEIDRGSTFYFTAKFAPAASAAPPADIAAEAVPIGTERASRLPQGAPRRFDMAGRSVSNLPAGLRILLVDDHEDNRFLIESYLNGMGCSIDIAQNGREAVDRFQGRRYDLVLMDVQMPEMDGYTAAGIIRQHERNAGSAPVPVLALTADAFEAAVDRSLQAGFTAHLTKPIRRATLLEALAEYAPAACEPPPAEAAAQKIRVTVPAEIEDLVPNYLDKRRKDLPKFTEALAAGKFDNLRLLGHNLKGTGASYGFQALTDIGKAIEQSALAGDIPAIQARVAELSRYLEDVEWSVASPEARGGIT